MSTVTKVYSNIKGIGAAIKDVGRLRQILLVLAKHGFGAAVSRLGLHDVVGIKTLVDSGTNNEPYTPGVRIRKTLEELGPTFIKLGQIVSTRSDLLTPDIINELEALQDDVPPMPWEDVQRQVESELGASVGSLFAHFAREPLASASVAQVHKAALQNGDEVVVKVQRLGIAPTIDSDLNILDFLARRAEALIPELKLIDPVGMVREFEQAIRCELDFKNEISNIERFRRNFAKHPKVHIPTVHAGLCTSRVITMEYIRGVKITQAPAKLGIDPYVFAPHMLRILFKMALEDGFFHGDLHPGNILIEEDGTIGLIDFGLVGRLTRLQRENILDILIGVSREDYQTVARVFFELGVKVADVRYDYAAFEADVVDIMGKHVADRTLQEIDVRAFFTDLVAGAIRHQIKIPPTYTMVFKALMTVEGIGKTLAPDVNFMEEVKPFIRDVLAERYSPKRLLAEGIDLAASASRFLRQFPLTATQVLRDLEQGRLSHRVELQGLQHVLGRQRQASIVQMRALMCGACMVAGAVALDSDGGRTLGMPTVSLALFGVAALFGLPLLIEPFRR